MTYDLEEIPRRDAPQPLSLLGLVSLRRRSLVACVLLSVIAGLGVAYLSPVTYTAQGQLISGATSVNAAAVPSFAQAGQSLAQTYSRVFAGDEVQQRLVADGFDPATETITASPVASSSVILVEAGAPNPTAALRAVDGGIDALSTTVSKLLDNTDSITETRSTLRDAYREQAEAEAAIEELDERLDKRRRVTSEAYEEAESDLGAASATAGAARQLLASQVGASVQANGVQRLTSAHVTSSTSTQRYQFWGAAGLLAGIAIWGVLALLRSRPPSRGGGRDGRTAR